MRRVLGAGFRVCSTWNMLSGEMSAGIAWIWVWGLSMFPRGTCSIRFHRQVQCSTWNCCQLQILIRNPVAQPLERSPFNSGTIFHAGRGSFSFGVRPIQESAFRLRAAGSGASTQTKRLSQSAGWGDQRESSSARANHRAQPESLLPEPQSPFCRLRGESTQSNGPCNVSARAEWTAIGRLRTRTASWRNAAFLPRDSARVTAISGRQIAMGIPGKPAPEPKSRRVEIPAGRARAQAMDSTKWRTRMPSSSRTAVRLTRAFQRRISEL